MELIEHDLLDTASTMLSGLWEHNQREKEIVTDFIEHLNRQNVHTDYFYLCDLGLYKDTFDERKIIFIKDSLNTKSTVDFIKTELDFLRTMERNPLLISGQKEKFVFKKAYEEICNICNEIFTERAHLLNNVLESLPEDFEEPVFKTPSLNNAQITLLLHELGLIEKIHKKILKKDNVTDVARFIQPLLSGEKIGSIKPRINPILRESSSKSDIYSDKNIQALDSFLSRFELKLDDLKK